MSGIFGGLALGIVKVSRHRDHGTIEVVIEGVFSSVTQGGQNIGTYLHRRFLALRRLKTQHAGVVNEVVGQFFMPHYVFETAPHETLG